MSEQDAARRGLLARVRTLRSIFGIYPWGLPAIVGLGVAASLAEGIGLSLFVPLIQSLDDSTSTTDQSWFVRALSAPFENLSPDDQVVAIGRCILGLIAVRAALSYANVLVFAWLDAHISHRLRSGIHRQLLAVEYRFVERSDFGALLNTLATETWRTSDALAVGVSLLISMVNMAIYIGLLLLLSVRLTLIVGLAMGVIALAVRYLTRRVEDLGVESTKANAALSARMVETLTMNPVIRTFGRESHEQDRFDVASRRVSTVHLRISRVAGAVGPVYQVLSGAVLVAVVVATLRDTADLSSLLVFVFVLYRLQPQVSRLDSSFVDLRTLGASVDDVTGLLDRSDKPYLIDGDRTHERMKEGISTEDVVFRYEPDEPPALDHVSIEIPAGRVTALVGPSGAGKSTLVKLLLRFYDPDGGRLLVDGRLLTDLEIASWRRSLALVSQDVQLFGASVADNIRYGRPGASDDDIRAAAVQADAHDFIERLPDGYDTLLGDHGTRLSGGQQQRITLARAIVRDPEVLILDEATNALDSRSERIIQDALDVLGDERTVVIIAHRFSTIEKADHVIVLDEGRVVESGDRRSLLAQDGLFRQLARIQSGVAEP